MKVERIIVAVDGSPNSVVAVEWAGVLAQATDADVVALHAFGLLEQFDATNPDLPGPDRLEVEQRLGSVWCAPLARAGVRFEPLVLDGNPVLTVLAATEDLHADVIVLGRRGLGGHPGLLLGSTSAQVARQSRVPVVIVPHE